MVNLKGLVKDLFVFVSLVTVPVSALFFLNKLITTPTQVNSKWIPVTHQFLSTQVRTQADIIGDRFSYATKSETLIPSIYKVGGNRIQTKYTVTFSSLSEMKGEVNFVEDKNSQPKWEIRPPSGTVIITMDRYSTANYGNPEIYPVPTGMSPSFDPGKKLFAVVILPHN